MLSRLLGRSMAAVRPRLAQGLRSAAQPAPTSSPWLPRMAFGIGAATAVAAAPPAMCAAASAAGSADGFLELVKPEYLTECGVGGFAGYAAGFALKRAAQVVIFTTGCLFIGMQVMANHGYITVHWEKIEKDWRGKLDTNGDGEVSHADMHSQYEQLVNVLESGVPGAAGFSAGFILGLRS